jgi:hypothetical protein
MTIVKPGNMKSHLTKKHQVISEKEAHPKYRNAMMNIYYYVVMPIGKFKEKGLHHEL